MTKWNVPTDEPKEDRPLHPRGTYDAVVVAAKSDKTKGGKDMIKLEFKTGHGKLAAYLVHSPESKGALWHFFRQLKALGVTEEFLAKDPDIEEVAMECVKARALISVDHETYQGAQMARVQNIEPVVSEVF